MRTFRRARCQQASKVQFESFLWRLSPRFAFYAGAPFTSSDGYPLCTLCVVDMVPRQLTPSQQNALLALSHQVQAQFELRKNLLELRVAVGERDRAERERDRTIVDLRQALEHVKRLSGLLPACSACKLDVTFSADRNAISGVVGRSHAKRARDEMRGRQ